MVNLAESLRLFEYKATGNDVAEDIAPVYQVYLTVAGSGRRFQHLVHSTKDYNSGIWSTPLSINRDN